MPFDVYLISMINETAEKITLLFYKLWVSKGVVTNEVLTIKIEDGEAEFECEDELLKQTLVAIANGDIILLKNVLTFMLQKNIICCRTKKMIDGMLLFYGIEMNHKSIDMIEGSASNNKEYQKFYNNTFALNINFSMFSNSGSLVEGRLGDIDLSWIKDKFSK